MAKKATPLAVAADMQPPNFRKAVQLIRGAIVKKKEDIARKNSEIADTWGTIEGHKVNKKAGQIFAALDKLEHVDRVDIMRSLDGLIDAGGWDEQEQDLVDASEGNVVAMRFNRQDNAPGDNEQGENAEIAELAEKIGEDDPSGDDSEREAQNARALEAANAKKAQLAAAAQADDADLAE